MDRARAIPLALATLAVFAGAEFLWDVGALAGMATRNAAAYLIGLLLGWGCLKLLRRPEGMLYLFVGAMILLFGALAGPEVGGVRRWIQIGSFAIQPALIVCPVLLAAAARPEGRDWRPLLIAPAIMIAWQPDAASLCALAAGAIVLSGRDDRPMLHLANMLMLLLALLSLFTMKTPPPVAFVEQTPLIAVTSGAAAVALHLATVLLMIAAPISVRSRGGVAVAVYSAVALLMASFFAFPMPLAGAAPGHLAGFGAAMMLLVGKSGRRAEA